MRGKINGMIGCACGDGVLDWERIISIAQTAPRDLVMSVECGSVSDAAKSFEYLNVILSRNGAAV